MRTRLIILTVMAACGCAAAAAPRTPPLDRPITVAMQPDPAAERRDAQDLQAQQVMADQAVRMADYTKGQLIVSIIGALGLGGTLLFSAMTLQQSGRTAHRQLRAYLSIHEYKGARIKVGETLRLNFRIKNFGQTPTSGGVISMSTVVVDNVLGHTFNQLQDGPYTLRDLVCGDDQGIFHQDAVIMTRPLLAQLAAGTHHVLFATQIDYRDAFGAQHRMRFSVYLSGKDLSTTRHNASFMQAT